MADLMVNINDLVVWTENPRHSDEIENVNIAENEVINILINVVGHNYMFNLAEDILTNGLMGNTLPVAVRKENKFLIYDGNRRISSIKFLLNPEIINSDNVILKNKINALLSATNDVDDKKEKLKSIRIYEATEQEAYEIMEKTHGGIMEGIGTLPWDAYQKDKANNKRGIGVMYPSAFAVATKLSLRKRDIKDEYTSLDRIFGNARFKALFNINSYEEINVNYLKQIYDLLQKYKLEEKNNQGFSRIFNKATEASEDFHMWCTPRLNPNSNYIIEFENASIDIFKTQALPEGALKFIVKDFNSLPIQNGESNSICKFINPSNIESDGFDNNITGEWKYTVRYQESENNLVIIVKDFVDPVLTLFNKYKTIIEGKSITNLRNEIHISSNSIDENVKNEVVISSDNGSINSDSFLSSNSIGEYVIKYLYLDSFTGKEVSALLNISVISATEGINVTIDPQEQLLIFDNASIFNNYYFKLSNNLKNLIQEMNNLKVNDYKNVLAASLRSIVHLLEEEYSQNNGKTSGKDIQEKLSNLIDALTNDFSKGHIIYNKVQSIDEANAKNAFRTLKRDLNWLIPFLNCGAHSAASQVTETSLRDAGKIVSKILTYIAILLY